MHESDVDDRRDGTQRAGRSIFGEACDRWLDLSHTSRTVLRELEQILFSAETIVGQSPCYGSDEGGFPNSDVAGRADDLLEDSDNAAGESTGSTSVDSTITGRFRCV